MVKYGYDEALDAIENADNFQATTSFDEAIDDTFAFAEPMKIPGSFVTNSPAQNFPRSSKVAKATVRERSAPLSPHGKCTSSYDELTNVDCGDSTREIADVSVVIDQQDVSMCDESDGEQTEATFAFEREPISRLNSWCAQLSHNKSRTLVLQEVISSLDKDTSHKRTNGILRNSYTAHELDKDLFGRRITAQNYIHFTKAERAYQFGGNRESAKLLVPPFAFRWTRHGMLVNKIENSLLLIEDARSAALKDVAHVDSCLKERLKHTDISVSITGVPFAMLRSSFTASAIQTVEMGKDQSSMWQLSSALFDERRGILGSQRGIIDIEKERKKAVSSWLKTSVMPSVAADEALVRSPTQLMYTRLTGFQLEEACSLALEHGDFRLATILPLAGGDREVQRAVAAQVAQWSSDHCTTLIDKFHRRIYNILSGSPTTLDDSTEDGITGETKSIPELDWKRTFGLILWYGTPAESTIGDALREFERTKGRTDWHMCTMIPGVDPVSDIQYHILSAAESVQSNISALLDFRKYPGSQFLQQFHMWLLSSYLLQNPRYLSLHQQTNQQQIVEDNVALELDQVILTLSELLLAANRFDWAIFVVLHLTVESTRETLIKTILAKNIQSVSDELSILLVRTFHIPQIWLQEAKALSLRAACQHYAEALCLLDAAFYNEAHSMLLRHLAPQSIITGKFDAAYNILCKLSQMPSIEGWEHGGAVYKHAIEIIQTAKDCKSPEDFLSTKHKSTQARRLIVSVSTMQPRCLEQAVAKTELLTLLTTLLLSTKSRPRSDHSTEEMKRFIDSSALRCRSMVQFCEASS